MRINVLQNVHRVQKIDLVDDAIQKAIDKAKTTKPKEDDAAALALTPADFEESFMMKVFLRMISRMKVLTFCEKND